MATSTPQQFNIIQNQQQKIALVKEKLKELGPGPYTPEQQKQKDVCVQFLTKEGVIIAHSQVQHNAR
jgi:hypothetical protein